MGNVWDEKCNHSFLGLFDVGFMSHMISSASVELTFFSLQHFLYAFVFYARFIKLNT